MDGEDIKIIENTVARTPQASRVQVTCVLFVLVLINLDECSASDTVQCTLKTFFHHVVLGGYGADVTGVCVSVYI